MNFISTFMNQINSFLSNTDFFQNQAHDLSVAESSEKGDNNQGFPNKPISSLVKLLAFFFTSTSNADRLQSWIRLERFTIFPLTNRIEHTISSPQG